MSFSCHFILRDFHFERTRLINNTDKRKDDIIMSNDYLAENVEMDCPICNSLHSMEKRKRSTQAIIKGQVVDYEEIYFLCPISDEEENEFVPAGIMDENL